MAPNKRKILEAARKHAQKGAKDRALKEYEKLLKLDPRDAKLRLEIGDAHRRWGQVEEAVAAYTRVAEQYTDEGFDARAVAVYKQIQNLDSERFDSYVPLSELYQRMGLTAEAIQSLQTAADGYHREGKKRDALDLLRRMATLDPSNTTSRLKVADLLRQEDMATEAVQEYQAACGELEKQGEHEAAGSALERILEIEPGHLETLAALARNLVKRGLAERAEPFAKRAVESQPEEAAHYELLADVYRAQQRDVELTETYKTLADLYKKRGDEDRAREIIQRFVPPGGLAGGLDGDALLENDELVEAPLLEKDFLEEGLDPAKLADVETPVESFAEETVLELRPEATPIEELVEPRQLDEEIESTPEIEVEIESEPEPEPEPEIELEPDPEPEIEGDPEQLLAEASVYLRYGKRQQAVKNLGAILKLEPRHRGALEKLGEAHADAGDGGEAVASWMKAAEVARDDGDEAGLVLLRDRIAALDEEAAASLGIGPAEPEVEFEEILDLDGDATISGAEVSAAAPEPEVEIDDDIEIDLDADDLDEGLDADELAGASDVEPESEAPATTTGANTSSSQQVMEELEEAEFYRQQGLLDEAEAIYQRVLQSAPNHPLALVRMGEIAAARGDDPGSTASGAPPTPEVAPGDTAAAADDAPGGDLAEWTDDGLSQDDFEISMDESLDDEEPAAALATGPTEEVEDEVEDLGAGLDVEIPDDLAVEVGLDTEERESLDAELALDDDDVELAAEEEVDLGADLGLDAEPEEDAALEPEVAEAESGEITGVDIGVDSDEASDADEMPAEPEPIEAPAPLAAAGTDADPNADSFDLAAELSEALDDGDGASTGSSGSISEDDVFAAVFSEFKKGVSKQLGEGDHEAHYDLGIAYREMGLLDDAVAEFRASMESASRRIDSLHMLGLCCLDLDRPRDAVGHLQAALDSESVSDEQTLAVRFELGRSFARLEEVEQAREAWEAVAAVDPAFCEVEERLAELDKPEAAVEDAEPTQEYESFGDLFEDEDEPAEAAPAAEVVEEAHESFEDLIAEAESEDEADKTPPPPMVEPEPVAEAPRPRRKKKISFV